MTAIAVVFVAACALAGATFVVAGASNVRLRHKMARGYVPSPGVMRAIDDEGGVEVMGRNGAARVAIGLLAIVLGFLVWWAS